jgi:hypothetical protein
MEKGKIEEIKRYFSVVAEGLEHKIQLVAEGIENVDEKLERFRQEVKEEFKETRSMIKFSHAELDRRSLQSRGSYVFEESGGTKHDGIEVCFFSLPAY